MNYCCPVIGHRMAQTYIGPLSRLIFKFLQAAFSIELMIRKGHRYVALPKWPKP